MLILNTKESLILAAPGLRQNVADAIVAKSRESNEINIKIILATSEEVCRLGDGDLECVNA